MQTDKKTRLLIILDGWGYSKEKSNNAIFLAKTPVWDNLNKKFPNSLINTSGKNVGLPEKQMGNSEVGHINLGAGRIVEQDFTRIQNDIENGNFAKNVVFKKQFEYAKKYSSGIHIMGLLSDGGVHSHEKHLHAITKIAHDLDFDNVYLHLFTDGRDCGQKSAKIYIEKIETLIANLNTKKIKIASIIGRYFAMDRDNRWDRISSAYNLITKGESKFTASSAIKAIDMAYKRGETDEFISATIIKNPVKIKQNDVVIFMNYRADRARQITQAFTDKDHQIALNHGFVSVNFVCLTEYKKEFNLPTAYLPINLSNVLGEYISNLNMTQLRIAETEKYAHVTFFLNGGIENKFDGEDRILIPSPNVATYDLKPEMSAFELTEELVNNIKIKKYDLIICNFANTDMVGHSGKLNATIKAVEAVDDCLGNIYNAIMDINGEILITADHGNAEKMFDIKTLEAHTAHTNNSVPLIYVGKRKASLKDSETGSLSDIAPTILHMMGIEKPKEMEGNSLISFE